MRPIAHPMHESVLYRIDVTILDVTRIIRFISDQMLPEPALPDAALTARTPHPAQAFVLGNRASESGLDETPAR